MTTQFIPYMTTLGIPFIALPSKKISSYGTLLKLNINSDSFSSRGSGGKHVICPPPCHIQPARHERLADLAGLLLVLRL